MPEQDIMPETMKITDCFMGMIFQTQKSPGSFWCNLLDNADLVRIGEY